MQTENLKQAIDIALAAQSQIAKLIKQLPGVALKVDSNFKQSINALSHAAGVSQPTTQAPTLGPIKSFMGKEIHANDTSVSSSAINPAEETKKDFIKKVNDLYAVIDSQESTLVLQNNTLPEDVLALRGVAKKAGVIDFEDAELNVAFIESIKAGKAKKEADKKARAEAIHTGGNPIIPPPSKEETAKQRIERIGNTATAGEIDRLMVDEDRATVKEAAEKRISELPVIN
ncbi:hypothetical protein ACLOAU_14595 [Niabella sp. CJ426]|uniref:hypothetical protein n=1 Tax=Niabella sp. CJ426 TaxID=3393740 RepID=UPI003D017870